MADDLKARAYYIRKRGMWYRPNGQGYTNYLYDAGLYTEQEAREYTYPNGQDGPRDGMAYFHESEVTKDGPTRRIEQLERERDALRDLVNVLLDNDPDDPISDGGHTVLDLWRKDARQALKDTTP